MSRLFQDELNYLKDMAKEWARLHPKLEKYFGTSSTDPDVERLMEGFAFLTSRLRETLDDELSELTHGVLNTVWPQFLRPFPPTAMLKFTPKDKAITARHIVPRGTGMFGQGEDGAAIPFHTTADVTIYPLELGNVVIEHTRERSVLTLDFATLSGLPLADIGLDDLRLTFCGDAATELYAWSLTRVKHIAVHAAGSDYRRTLRPNQFKAGALGPEDALLEETSPLFGGYRLLQEYFLMPDKLTCLDISGLTDQFSRMPGSEFSLVFEYEGVFPPDIKVTGESVRLYCVPAQNLFPHKADNVDTQTGRPQPLTPHVPPGAVNFVLPEICSVERVSGSSGENYKPFASFEHDIETATNRRAVYYRHIREPVLSGLRWEHKISFVNHAGEPVSPKDEQVGVELLCFNGDRPAALGIGAICHRQHDTPSFVDCANITVPSRPVYPPLDSAVPWQFISNLSPHHFILRDREAFAGFITVYDYIAAHNRLAERAAKRRADSILAMESKPVDRLFAGRPKRGLNTKLTLSEKGFSSEGEMYLFATVLSEFMGIFATTNSFHRLEVEVSETGQRFQWDAKTGRQPLL